MENQEKEVIEKKKKKDYKTILKYFGIAVIILTAVIFLFIKISTPELDSKWFILGGGFILIGVGLIKGFDWYNQLKKIKEKKTPSDEVPSAADKEKIKKELENFILERENHIKYIKDNKPFNFGNNQIYVYKLKLWYNDGENGDEIIVILNANYLEKPFQVLSMDSSDGVIKRAANGLSSNPEVTPEVEETETHDPTTGKVHKYRKTTPPKKKNKEKETEDLA